MKRPPTPSPPVKRLRTLSSSPQVEVMCRLTEGGGGFELLGEDLLRAGRDVYLFDRVFPPKAPQRDLFHSIGLPLSRVFLEGRSGVLCLYGPDHSGKKFTLIGTPTDPGLFPRLVQELQVTSLSNHLVADYFAISPQQTRQLIGAEGNSWRIKTVQDVFSCFEQGEKRVSPDDNTKILVLKTKGSIRNGVVAMVMTKFCKNTGSAPWYSLLQSCYSRSAPCELKLLQPLFTQSDSMVVVVTTVDSRQTQSSSLHLRLLGLLIPIPDSIQRRQSHSPSRKSIHSSQICFLNEVISRRNVTINRLSRDLRISLERIESLSDTDTERRVRREVVQGLSQTLDSLERSYKESTTLVLDTYQGILADRSVPRLCPQTQDVFTQVSPPRLHTSSTQVSPSRFPAKAKSRAVKISPIHHHTRKADRLKKR